MKRRIRPLIGVTGSRRKGRIMTALNRFAVWRAGGRSVALRPGGRAPRLYRFDGFVIGGGDDIDPALYDGKIALDVRIDKARDQLELDVLREAERRKLPVLGICRGSQLMNVFYGGSLIGDIYRADPGLPRIRTVLARKRVRTVPGTLLHDIMEKGSGRINSLHHQAVEKTGDNFDIAARDEYGLIQGTERLDGPLRLGVQWHPEMLVFHRDQVQLFRTLVEVAKNPWRRRLHEKRRFFSRSVSCARPRRGRAPGTGPCG